MNKYKFKTLDLLKNHDRKIWIRLRQLSFTYEEGGQARNIFYTLENIGPEQIRFWENRHKDKYPKSFIRICIYNNNIIAWSMSFLGSLNCYTQSKFRNKQIQKRYLMPYMKKHAPGLSFTIGFNELSRLNTFKYYKLDIPSEYYMPKNIKNKV